MSGKRRRRQLPNRKSKRGPATKPTKKRSTTVAPHAENVESKDPLNEAVKLLSQGGVSQALPLFRSYVKRHPDDAFGWIGLADCISRVGDMGEAIQHARRGIEIESTDSRFQTFYADLLFKDARCDDSLVHAQRAIGIDPTNVNAHCLIARNLEQMQRISEAIDRLKHVSSPMQEDGYLLITLGHLEARERRFDDAKAHLEAGLNDSRIFEDVRILGLNELATVLDRLGEYEAAFENFERCGEATQQCRAARPFDLRQRLNQIAAYRSAFTADLLSAMSSNTTDDSRRAPAFLVGFPRSGTTMLEQALASHPVIRTTGEQPMVNQVRAEWARMTGPENDVAAMIRRLQPAAIKKLQSVYWRSAADYGIHVDESELLVDKLPLNLIELGLINVIFPDSKVIVALRDPRDVCLSCLFQNFRLNASMIHFTDLERTARFYAATMDLYLQLRESSTLALLEIRYEDTVADFESQTRRVLEFLGVEWDARVLAFHEQARTQFISTPSYTGVTEKVYASSVARWRNYEEHIGPVMPILDRYVREFGYD